MTEINPKKVLLVLFVLAKIAEIYLFDHKTRNIDYNLLINIKIELKLLRIEQIILPLQR